MPVSSTQRLAKPIEPLQIIIKRIKGLVFSIADMNSAYNQMPLDKLS